MKTAGKIMHASRIVRFVVELLIGAPECRSWDSRWRGYGFRAGAGLGVVPAGLGIAPGRRGIQCRPRHLPVNAVEWRSVGSRPPLAPPLAMSPISRLEALP